MTRGNSPRSLSENIGAGGQPANSLDEMLGRGPLAPATGTARLGVVVDGSLSDGLTVRLDAATLLEHMAVGRYVVIHGADDTKFFCIVTDIRLDATDPAITASPPDFGNPFTRAILAGTTVFGAASVSPMLVLSEHDAEPRPVKTVPSHFMPVFDADAQDVQAVFSPQLEAPGAPRYFWIGDPLDMEGVKVYINLDRFVERSSGVFGKSGTGKTFLTRMLLAGIVRQRAAVNLVFDMHNEYGWSTQAEDRHEVKALRQMFYAGEVSVVTLDPDSSRWRGAKTDLTIEIGLDQIEPEDIEMIAGLLDLSEIQVGALHALRRRLGPNWIKETLDYEHQSAPSRSRRGRAGEAGDDEGGGEADTTSWHPIARLIESNQLVEGTLGAIQRKLEVLRRFTFLKEERAAGVDTVKRVMEYLARGVSIVMEFGRYDGDLRAYILVANYFTRRIHEEWKKRKEQALGKQGEEPRQLVITIEEAHKFLSPAIAEHTIFGTIARELRKYNVTLLVVDQRPSGIDDEVMSQLGTRVVCLLDNEADVRAVFSGVSGGQALREVLARLDTKQQALILGHAVPMPVVVRARPYDADFYAAMGDRGPLSGEDLRKQVSILRGSEDDSLV